MNAAPPILDPQPPSFDPLPAAGAVRDRRVGLILFGTVLLFLAALCWILAGLIMIATSMLPPGATGPPGLRFLLPGVMVYAQMGLLFLVLGIGSIACRRWARALTLIVSCYWLAVGLITVPLMAWILPKMLASNPATQPLPPGTLKLVLGFQLGFMAVFFILLPAGFVWFYGARNVRATCERRDPRVRWTDACPLPVLGIAFLAWVSAAMILPMAACQMAVVPVFGQLVAGVPGGLVMVFLAAGLVWIGGRWYEVRASGWWSLVLLLVVFGASAFVTFSRIEFIELYRAMGYPAAQIELIQRQGWINNRLLVQASLLWALPVAGYLFWVRRYFRPASDRPGDA